MHTVRHIAAAAALALAGCGGGDHDHEIENWDLMLTRIASPAGPAFSGTFNSAGDCTSSGRAIVAARPDLYSGFSCVAES